LKTFSEKEHLKFSEKVAPINQRQPKQSKLN